MCKKNDKEICGTVCVRGEKERAKKNSYNIKREKNHDQNDMNE